VCVCVCAGGGTSCEHRVHELAQGQSPVTLNAATPFCSMRVALCADV
jgi:hypothetical protein